MKTKLNVVWFLFIIVPALLQSSLAFADAPLPYDICGTLRFFDSRTHRFAGSVVDGGAGDANALYVEIELWDRDGYCVDSAAGCGETDDDQLAVTYSSSSDGSFCFTDISADMDIYFLSRFDSDDTRVRFDLLSLPLVITSDVVVDFGAGGDLIKDWNLSCPSVIGGLCNSGSNVQTFANRFANALATGVDVDKKVSESLYATNGFSSPVTIRDRGLGVSRCPASGNKTLDCEDVCMNTTDMTSNHTVAHEIGHVLHRRNHLLCDDPISGCTGSWLQQGTERCVTSEGFADFVSLMTHWPRGHTAPVYQVSTRNGEGWTTIGNSASRPCAFYGSNAHQSEANVARYFWDLYDTVNHSSDNWLLGIGDVSTHTFDEILLGWNEFPKWPAYHPSCPGAPECCAPAPPGGNECAADRENREPASNPSNGRNVWDYVANFGDTGFGMYINCVSPQEP